jgi:hypothetical protein
MTFKTQGCLRQHRGYENGFARHGASAETAGAIAMGTVIDFQAKKEEFLKREAERRAEWAEQRAERLEQLKEFGASFADQVRFSLDTDRLLAGGAKAGYLARPKDVASGVDLAEN